MWAVPTGANMSWSSAMRFSAGTMAAVFVIGKVLVRNPNHLCCMGAIKKPYDMKRVKRSKSNGGGSTFESGMRSRSEKIWRLSNS